MSLIAVFRRPGATLKTTFLAVLLMCGSVAVAQPIPSLRDDEGRPALLGTPAERVVTLAPSLTELVYAAGAGDKLVAVSAYSDFPQGAVAIPQVADAAGIAWESLLAQRPDLVLAWKGGTRQADIARLNGLGINVFVVDIRQLDDIPRILRNIGKLVSRTDPAEQAAALFENRLAAIRQANAGKRVVSTFFEISLKPLMTVNRDHVISEVIGLCGGRNAFADAPTLVSEPSREALLMRNPEAILHGQSTRRAPRPDPDVYAGLSAYRAGRIYGVNADYVFRPGPRLLLAADEVCTALDRARASLTKK